jgi:hypothetical protein
MKFLGNLARAVAVAGVSVDGRVVVDDQETMIWFLVRDVHHAWC